MNLLISKRKREQIWKHVTFHSFQNVKENTFGTICSDGFKSFSKQIEVILNCIRSATESSDGMKQSENEKTN
jgi:hypothetical protein